MRQTGSTKYARLSAREWLLWLGSEKDQRDRAAVGLVGLETGLPEQMARKHAVRAQDQGGGLCAPNFDLRQRRDERWTAAIDPGKLGIELNAKGAAGERSQGL